ncbi:MAG: PLP-dependent aminotransferase family protein, partial [Polyangiaceae bacterium]
GIVLNKEDGEPLYKQLFDQVVRRILSGAFPAGFRLPPTRELACELSTNRNTVVRAYTDLENAGFVKSAVGRGTFVALQSQVTIATPRPVEGGLPWASLLSGSSKLESLRRARRFQAVAAAGRDVVNLTRMQPSPDLIPDKLLRHCFEHVLRQKGADALGYAPAEGLPRLRELIVEDLARQGVPARADDIVITSGSQQALDLIARSLIDPGDNFLVDAATYAGAIDAFSLTNARLVPVPTDNEGPDLASLERLTRAGAKGLYIMPNCNNPTGAEISTERRRELVAWSERAGVPLIEDDYGSDLWLGETPPPPALRSLSGDVLYVGTFSKKLVPALRVGYVVCPPALRPTLVYVKKALDLGSSLVLQHVLAEFLERGYLRAHLGRILPEYRIRRDALEESLAKNLPPGMTWRRPERGLVLWLPLPEDIDSEAVFEEAQRRGVLVGPSALYEVEVRRERGLRLAFCAEDPARLSLGGKRLGEALRALVKQPRRPKAAGAELQTV